MILISQCQHKVKVCSAYHLFLFSIALKLCFVTSHILVDLFVKHENFMQLSDHTSQYKLKKNLKSQLYCKRIKKQGLVSSGICKLLYFLCLKKAISGNVLSLNFKLLWTKVDIKSIIRDYVLENYVVNVYQNLLKHANYLNTVLKSSKTRCSWATNCWGLMDTM